MKFKFEANHVSVEPRPNSRFVPIGTVAHEINGWSAFTLEGTRAAERFTTRRDAAHELLLASEMSVYIS